MMKKFSAAQISAATLGALLLMSAGTAVASAAPVDDSDVNINVEVTDRYPSGVLALSVAANSMNLTEVDSDDPLVREFTGTLPTVTVADTRSTAPEVPWAVLGTVSDFVSGDATIGGEHLGWSPYLVDAYGPDVESGTDIETVIDDPASEGLAYADGELLYVNYGEMGSYEQGSWSAAAGLQLKVDAVSVAAGNYTAALTLSLFE